MSSNKTINGIESSNNWREQAKALFFVDHIGTGEIAVIVKKARETVSRYLNQCEGYDAEMAFRRRQSKEERREYQKQWDREKRNPAFDITKESLRREHEIAVRILSSEKY